MNYPNQIIINEQDAWNTWNLLMLEGTYKELLKAPKRKESLSHEWADQDGTERDVAPDMAKYKSRSLSIPCIIVGNTSTAAWLNYSQFMNYIRTCGYFIMDVPPLNMQFKLLYDDMASMEDPFPYFNKAGQTVLQFTLGLLDDYPFWNDQEFNLIDLGLGDENYLADSDGEFITYE